MSAHIKAKRGWYTYAAGCEVFSLTSVGVYLPLLLEQLARDHGYVDGDILRPCSGPHGLVEGLCSVKVGLLWVDTASFSLYIKSASVALQAVSVISISVLADLPFWRKRLLIIFALLGAISTTLFLLLPSQHLISVYLAALLAIVSVAAFGDSFVCLNSFLPELVRGDPQVADARKNLNVTSAASSGEAEGLLAEDEGDEQDGVKLVIHPDTIKAYHRLLSVTTTRISSIGIGIGYATGVSFLCLTVVPVTLLQGSTFSLQLAIGASGIWWGLLTIPSAAWLPGSSEEAQSGTREGDDVRSWIVVKRKLRQGWVRIWDMTKVRELRRLRVTFWYLLAWALLSDAFNTMNSVAILFAKTALNMSSSKVILVGIISQSCGIFSALFTPWMQRRTGWANKEMMIGCVVGVVAMCFYVLLGLALSNGWTVGGLRSAGEMYVIAVYFGMIYGCFTTLSRTVFAEIIPQGHEARFFSLFSVTDKSASFLGPAVIGTIADYTGEIRWGFLFLAGLLMVPIPIMLWKVDVELGRSDAEVYSREEASEVSA